MEPVPALGHHTKHLPVPVLAEADGAHGVCVRAPAGERDLGVGRDGGEVESDRGRCGGGGRGVCRVGGLGALRNEEHARDGDGDVAGAGRRRDGAGGVPGPVVPAAGVAAAEVGREEEGRDQDEEAECDGDGVAEAEVRERGEEGHGGCSGGGRSRESVLYWRARGGMALAERAPRGGGGDGPCRADATGVGAEGSKCARWRGDFFSFPALSRGSDLAGWVRGSSGCIYCRGRRGRRGVMVGDGDGLLFLASARLSRGPRWCCCCCCRGKEKDLSIVESGVGGKLMLGLTHSIDLFGRATEMSGDSQSGSQFFEDVLSFHFIISIGKWNYYTTLSKDRLLVTS